MLFSAKCLSTARLDGKTVVITGCNTGIGKYTAKNLFQRGAKVIMACRNINKANEAAEDIIKECAHNQNLGKLQVIQLDLCSLKSVNKCAMELIQKENRIDILINNAGVMACPLMRTEDGLEMQFGTNHLGHFLFTLLLIPKIKKSTPARIINVASIAHKYGSLNFNDLNWEKRTYSPTKAYAASKLANILFSRELSRRFDEAEIKSINTYSLHPGVINTDLGRHLGSYSKVVKCMWLVMASMFGKTIEQGSQTTIYCAVSEEVANETGLYYAECKVSSPSSNGSKDEDAKRLWNESLKLVGLAENYDPFNI